ncbi:MAG: hypothetical protein E7358_07000 [Clostridiales bacterium]|nr:hypothetical protein [Clostridiales bacterium]
MDNNYLRLNNNELKTDKNVNIYSAKHSKIKDKEKKNSISAISMIIDEVYGVRDTAELIAKDAVEKPKILDAIIFSFVFLLFIMALTFVCNVVKDLLLLLTLCVIFALFIPISLVYFFYRLDVRGKLKFSSLFFYSLFGGAFLIFIEFTFNTMVNKAIHDYFSTVALRCLIELLGVFLISTLFIRNKFNRARTTSIMITCAVSAGFAFTKALFNNYTALLVDVDVETNLGFFEYGMRIGAILNQDGFIGLSLENLLSKSSLNSFLQPLIFMLVAIIFIDVFESEDWSITKRAVRSIFAFLFCATTYILMSIHTSFNILSMLYRALSVVFVLYLFIRTVNGCIKSENYE